MLNFLQRISKSLAIPLTILPTATLMLRLGQEDLLNIKLLNECGQAIFINLPLIFAIGVAIGMSEDENGISALSGAIGYFILNSGSKNLLEKKINSESLALIGSSIIIGIIAGVIAGLTYNKFKNVKLPDILGFFGGKRLVPVITSGIMIMISYLNSLILPLASICMEKVNSLIISLDVIGIGLFGFFNRLLMPTGLHHILNNYFWFNLGEFNGVTGDMWRFISGDSKAGAYMAGFFPVMMFGLPAAALAIYLSAKKENKKSIAGLLISIGVTSFLTGITEPIELLFMFVSPILLIIHSIITGLSLMISSIFGVLHGFTFSAGAIDYLLNFNLATKPLVLIPIGLVVGILYFISFYWAIKRFNIQTLGRENRKDLSTKNKSLDLSLKAIEFIENLGGKNNIVTIGNCTTRLRIEVKENSLVDEVALKELGAKGVIKIGNKNVQVIIGTDVQFVCDAINKELKIYMEA